MSFPSASFLGGFCRTSAYRVHLSPHIRISIRSLSSHVSVTPTSRSFRISQLPQQRPYKPQHLSLQWRSISSTPDQPSQPNPAEAKKSTSILARLLPSSISPTADSTSSLRKIIALAKPEKKIIGIAVSLLFVSSAVSMSIPFTVGRLIDYFSSANANLFMGLSPTNALIVLTLVFTAGGLANAGRVILLRLAGLRIVSRLRTDAYKAALRQEVEYVERGAGEGDLISRLNVDAGIVGESVTQNLSDGLRSIVTASVGLTAMFWLSPTMTLLMLSIVPSVSIGAVIYGRYLKSISRKTQQALGDMSKVAHETLHSLRIVQAFNAYGLEEKKFHKKVWNVADFLRKEAWASGTFFGSTGWAGNVTILMLLGYGGTLVSRGEISVGDLTSLLLYTAYVGSSLTTLSSFFSSLMKGIGAGSRVFSLLERQPAIRPNQGVEFVRPTPGDPIRTIRLENVSFNYPSRPNASVLKDLNLDIRPGESVAIVGKSGTGKSSIQSLLLRFYDPDSGRITYGGRDIKDFTPNSWRSFISIVPQEPVLFTGTIASNIAYGKPDATREEIEEAARQANCDFVWNMPNGFDTEVGRASLSGGQKQRIAIARALITKPSILLLDEATSALDAASEHQVNDAIDRILQAGNLTSLIVAHRLSTIARAERVVVLEGGHIVEEGTYGELATRLDSRFRELMKAQFTAAGGERTGTRRRETVTEEEVATSETVSEGSESSSSQEDPSVTKEGEASRATV